MHRKFEEIELPNEHEMNLLDIAVVLAENAGILIGWSVIGATLAFLVALFIPKVYQSTSLLKAAETEVAIMTSDDVLIKVLEKLEMKTDPHDLVISQLKTKIFVTYRKKDGILQLTTEGTTPEAALLLNITIEDATKQFVRPKGRNLESVEEQIRITSGSFEELRLAVIRVGKSLDKVKPGTEAEAMTRSYILMVEQRDTKEKQLFDLHQSLKKRGSEYVIQSPVLSTMPIKSKKLLMTIAGMFVFGLGALIFVFFRHHFSYLKSYQPLQFEKLQRLKGAFNSSGSLLNQE